MSAFLLVLAALLAQDAGLPLSLADAEPRPPKRQEEPPAAVDFTKPPSQDDPLLRRDDGGFVDLDWLELQPRVGLAIFSDDWRIDPSPVISLLVHAPLPWLSPASDPGGDYFGLFMEAGILPRVERDLDPAPDDNAGSAVLFSFGLDYTAVRNQALYLVFRAGAQYGWFGGIEGLGDGIAPMAGLDFGVYVGSGLTLTLAPAGTFGRGGDSIYTTSLGLVIEF